MKHVTRYVLAIAFSVCAVAGASDLAHAEAKGQANAKEQRFDRDADGTPDMLQRMARWQDRKDDQAAKRVSPSSQPAADEQQ